MVVIVGARDNRRHRRHSSRGGQGRSRSCAAIMFAVLVAALVTVPFILVGPMNLVLSVNISPREEQNRTGALSGVRGLNGRWTTKAKQETPPVQTEAGQPVDRALLGGAQSDSAAVNVGVDAAEGAGDLCLGMAVGISPAQLVTFVASFREVAPGAELVLFFEAPISARFNDIIDMFDVVALPVDREQLEPMVLRRYHPSSVRWVMFQRFLDVEGSNYERVLMVDAGQAFFQGNPFDIIGNPGIYTFTGGRLIGESQQHSKKIQDCLGAPVLAQLADKPALHSGVSLATSSLAIDYARQMSKGIVSPTFQACERAGVDGGLHDYLIYNGGVKGAVRFDQETGPVVDVQGGKYESSDSRILNLSGREVPVVYRYVENETFKAYAFSRYIYWAEEEGTAKAAPVETGVVGARQAAPKAAPTTVADEKQAAPAASPRTVDVAGCLQYSLSEGVDMFKAKCDLASGRVASLSGCCAACTSHRACQAFSFDNSNGMCFMKNCDDADAPGPSNTVKSITSGAKSKPTLEARTTR